VNPAIPVLLLLCAAGLLWQRRGAGVVWATCGLIAFALLAPALALPDGFPSPSALLSPHPPWQGVGDPGLGNPHLLDITHQVEPWLLFLRDELRDGRLPFWNPHQFSGEPYWSNGSSAPLFPLHLLFAASPVQLGLVLLPWLRLVVGGLGAWYLARALGSSRRAALVAAVVYPFSGTVVSFLLFPMGNTHALVPWVLWSVERVAAGTGSWVALALTGGLQLLGGHPETPVFTGMLAVVYLLVRSPARRWRAWSHFAVGWVGALALSAVQILPLAATVLHSSKWHYWEPPGPIPWDTKLSLILRLVHPNPYGSAADATWWGPFNDPATALFVGSLTLPLAVAGAWLARSEKRIRGILAMTAFALLAGYHFPGFKQLLLAIPVVSHGIHHYLKIGVVLGVALLAAAGWDRYLEGRMDRAMAVGALALALASGLVVALFRTGWQEHDQLPTQVSRVLFSLALALLLVAILRLSPLRRRQLWWVAPAVLAVDLVMAHQPINPALSATHHYPRTDVVELLTESPGRFAGVGATLRPNAAMVYRLYDVRGDSPVKLEHYQQLYARLAAFDPVYFRPIGRWQDPWLDQLGVRWAVTGPDQGPPAPGWPRVYQGHDARIYERPGALPLVRWQEGHDDGLEVLLREPGRWRVRWSSPEPRVLVVAETWDPGWRAWVEGQRAPVESWREVLLGVELPAGSGELELAYRPRWLVAGVGLSLLAAAAITWGGLRGSPGALLRARRRSRPGSAPASRSEPPA
jgi:hypothetical protein